jgi:acyl-CoA hydrolase/GNAT superfamily N-acetyltransferase
MNAEKKWDPDWQKTYASQLATAGAAVSQVRPGQRVFVGTGCAQPQALVAALTARSSELADTQIVHLLTMGDAPYAHRELTQHFTVNSFFIAENVRDVIQEGLGDYTPIFLSDIPRLFASGQLPLDVALIQVSPPDTRGLVSLGISVDIVRAAAENAGLVIAQVNPRMPRTQGNSLLSVHDIDLLVPVDAPLLEYELPQTDPVTDAIGAAIAGLVEDGSTLELGIGRIPHAALSHMADKRDLGIHTEMLTDAVVDLIEAGVITGAQKSVDPGRVVASFCFGTRKLYDSIDDNPVFAFHPTEYVNDPFVIGRQNKMVAVNVALEVDLTGQVCADSLGTRFFSGIGGQVDFNRGAARAEQGKAIIALPSTAKAGSVSRIVAQLSPGAGVVTTRGDVHYVVTEYGVAYLHGKSVAERAIALIAIAHPDSRAELLHQAVERKLLRPELADVGGRMRIEPPDLQTTFVAKDGTSIHFRPMLPTDEPAFRELFYGLSADTLFKRFMSHMRRIPTRQIQNFVFVDHRDQVAIVGTVPEAHGEAIVAVGRYFLDPKTNLAEAALLVADSWQGRGLGKFLLGYLATIARRAGIAGFTAEVLRQNRAMQAVIAKAGLQASSRVEDDVLAIEIRF